MGWLNTELIKAMEIVAKKCIKKTDINHTISGRIIASLGSGKYTVMVDGQEYPVKSHFTHALGDIVKIVVCNGDYSQLYVLY